MTAIATRSAHAREARTTAPNPHSLEVRPRSRRLLTVLTVLTIIYVAIQATVGLKLRTDTWPISGFPMFADSPTENDAPFLTAVDNTGATVSIPPAALGITRDELAFWVGRHVAGQGGVLLANGPAALSLIARSWHERHPTTLREVTLTQVVTDLVHHRPNFTRTVATWNAP